jgi:RNA-directed DNA polymerase
MLIERIAYELALPDKYVLSLLRTASFRYKTYYIPKRGGGQREIHHPSKSLKSVQRWLLRHILMKLPVHTAAMAYIPGRSIANNARVHSNSRFLLRMDFTNFFPSISDDDIRNYIDKSPVHFSGWEESDVEVFCRFVCRWRFLTIGAPTSPTLSNILCYELDERLSLLATHANCSYTRYADDLFFSTELPNVLKSIESSVLDICSNLSIPKNLTINSSKTRHSSKRGRRRVTGLVLSTDKTISVGRNLKRKIRSLIHKYDSLDTRTRRHLSGLITYVASIDPEFINSLIQVWPERSR